MEAADIVIGEKYWILCNGDLHVITVRGKVINSDSDRINVLCKKYATSGRECSLPPNKFQRIYTDANALGNFPRREEEV